MLRLKSTLKANGLKQSELARDVSVSTATIAQIINHNEWPKKPAEKELKSRIKRWLAENGVTSRKQLGEVFEVEPPRGNAATPDGKSKNHQSVEDDNMLLRKQSLTQNAKRAFGVLVDPFGDLEAVEDMWISQDLRYVREAMFQIAKFGGLLAIIGESGAGKSTLRRDLCCRLVNEPIIVVQPYVIAAEENDTKGKTLKSTHIAEALLAAVAPTDKIKNSPQARFAQLHKALIDSHKSGYRHCLLLEEAHSLPIATLKHLKRIMELEHGFKKLVSVMLIGQPELKAKLSERNAEVREVVQRCEVVELLPIEPKQLKSFLEYRFKRIGIDVGKVINDQGIDAIAKRLVSRDKESQLYPLAVGNFLISAMNLAAQLGEKVVNAEVVQGV